MRWRLRVAFPGLAADLVILNVDVILAVDPGCPGGEKRDGERSRS
jgi:hypothetical protein